jgi:DMSO/TMAO reductase YedYZ molybdopterin-dependent catalytic subunit/thiosulfate reductase cytochrome b subunit
MLGSLTFPIWLRATHFLTIVFISLLIRSGLEILSAGPRLYLNDDCRPGSEWLTLSPRRLPEEGLWTSTDMEEEWPSWLALPGGSRLGLGRHWHFLAVLGWILTGAVYIGLLFVTDEWHRLIPASLRIFPQAVRDLGNYLALHVPSDGGAYNALQQLTYFAIVFIVSPLQIATGAAMSPAIDARFPRYVRLFGGRQRARSLHFVLLVSFCIFILMHTVMVVVHGLGLGLNRIVLGSSDASHAEAAGLAATGLLFVIALHVAATAVSKRRPRATRAVTGAVIGIPERLMSRVLRPSARTLTKPVSAFHWVNGRPPVDATYRKHVDSEFRDWRLSVTGLVERPADFDLDELRAMPSYRRRSLHHCIQGWSSVADWRGVPIAEIFRYCRPRQEARYAVFWGMDDKAQTDHQGEGYFFEALRLDVLETAAAFLAYEMNGGPLPIEYGAPLRLRVENQLGFKMVKWVCRIELVAEVGSVGHGGGGWREDHQQFENVVAI